MPTDDRRRIAEQTAADPTLCAVRDALRSPHWPRQPILGPYEAIRHELSVWKFPGVDGFLILRGERVVIPTAATQRVIELAHSGHPGVDKTLQRLREAVWWPGFTKEVKQVLTNCSPCVIESKVRRVPLQPRRLPSRPWHTVSVDIFYYQSKPFLSFLDVYSRYPTVVLLRAENAAAVTQACEQVFSLFGTPTNVISENGPQFLSAAFAAKCKEWQCNHERTVPYQPRQNPVERLHQTLKRLMRKSGQSSIQAALQSALQVIRSTVCDATGRTPGDVLLRGGYNTPLRNIQPSTPDAESDSEMDDEIRAQDATMKEAAKTRYDLRHRCQDRTVDAGDHVYVKEASGDTRQATVVSATPHDVVLEGDDGSMRRRHLDTVRPAPSNLEPSADSAATPTPDTSADHTTDQTVCWPASSQDSRPTPPLSASSTIRKSTRTHKPRTVMDL
ncbi:uncharacterized protein K02A2.6-like [Sycon ciliatum]|uniref:uncharacterized protein K02A2.6-like n=1 Tax=Sycon ciliatum TaxID=27933 RepID=UPI0031F643F1